jgi:hypothetical protein
VVLLAALVLQVYQAHLVEYGLVLLVQKVPQVPQGLLVFKATKVAKALVGR